MSGIFGFRTLTELIICLNIQGVKIRNSRDQQEIGSNPFLPNVGKILPDYMAPRAKSQYS
jgi:hypothetical protein